MNRRLAPTSSLTFKVKTTKGDSYESVCLLLAKSPSCAPKMNFKDLVEPECGGANPLMRLGQQLTSEYTLRGEGAANFRDLNFQPAEV